ncbi:MAG: hypothetical protein KC609_10520, partial [Myxococcales bacterium]|nr:hypothetical protein [Myxococcales bacterium]
DQTLSDAGDALGEDGTSDTIGDADDLVDAEPSDQLDSEPGDTNPGDDAVGDIGDATTSDAADIGDDASGALVSASHINYIQFCASDHSFALFGALANIFLANQVASREITFLLQLSIESDPLQNALSWYRGTIVGDPPLTTQPPLDWKVQTSSKVAFDTVYVGNVVLNASKTGAFPLALAFEGVPFALIVQSMSLSASLGAVVPDGFGLSGGTVTGMVLESDFKAAMIAAKSFCATAPSDNSVCPIVLAWDLDTNTIPGVYDDPLIVFDQKVGDSAAASICFDFSSVPAKIVGQY